MKNKYLLLLCCTAFSSCFFFPSFQLPGYHYNYDTFNKGLDYDKKIYLLNPVNFKSNEFSKGTYLPIVTKFFKNKLGDNLYKNTEYRDSKGRLKIPFDFNYEITDSQIIFLKQNTDLDYIILTKILSLEQVKGEKLNSVDRRRFQLASSGGISFIKIIDIKTNTTLLEMSCSATIIISNNMMSELEAENQAIQRRQPFTIYKSSKKLKEKSIKKLLKKIF
jgi:hypothetical protein